MRQDIKKKIIKTSIYTLLFAGSLSVSFVPTTNAIFYLDEKEALRYDVKLYNMYSDDKINLVSKTPEKAKLKFNFPINNYAKDEKDVYNIDIPVGCTFDNAPSSVGTKKPIGDTRYVVTIDKNSGIDGNVSVSMTCEVKEITSDDKLLATAYISEVIGTTDTEEFLYAKRSFEMSLDEYMSDLPVDNPDIVVDDNLYAKFKSYIELYASNHNCDAIREYVFNTYTDESKLRAIKSIPGLELNFKTVEEKEILEVIIKENLIGYSKTWKDMHDETTISGSYNFYIDTKNEEEMKKAFDLYLENYFFKDAETLEFVKKNIEDNGGIVAFIKGEKIISGLSLTDETNKFRINVDTFIYKKEFKDKGYITIPIEFDTNSGDAGTIIKNALIGNHDDIISPELVTNLIDHIFDATSVPYHPLYSSIMTGIKESDRVLTNNLAAYYNYDKLFIKEAKKFLDYFMLYDTDLKHYVLFKISSKDATSKQVSIDKIEFVDGITLNFENLDDKLTITINSSNSMTDIDDTIDKLKVYFNIETETIVKNVISNVSGNYSVEFTLEKDIENALVKVSTGTNSSTNDAATEGPSIEDIPASDENSVTDNSSANEPSNPTKQDAEAVDESLSPAISGGNNPESPVKLAENTDDVSPLQEVTRTKLATRPKKQETVIEEDNSNDTEITDKKEYSVNENTETITK